MDRFMVEKFARKYPKIDPRVLFVDHGFFPRIHTTSTQNFPFKSRPPYPVKLNTGFPPSDLLYLTRVHGGFVHAWTRNVIQKCT